MADRTGAGRKGRLPLLLALAGVLLGVDAAAQTEEERTIPTRPGVTLPFLVGQPAQRPVASALLFAGGDGRLNLRRREAPGWGQNFVVRNRSRFTEHGFLTAVVDVPSDRPDGLDRFRTSAAHAEDVRALIAELRRAVDGPVWLVSTSAGTLSAANAAARLRDGGPDGIVLTSSLTRHSRQRGESLDDVRLKDIRIPTLVVHHRDDGCVATPYQDAPGLLKELRQAPRRELLTFEGGEPARGEPCGPLAPHGYLGLDATVVEAIAAWIKATPKP